MFAAGVIDCNGRIEQLALLLQDPQAFDPGCRLFTAADQIFGEVLFCGMKEMGKISAIVNHQVGFDRQGLAQVASIRVAVRAMDTIDRHSFLGQRCGDIVLG